MNLFFIITGRNCENYIKECFNSLIDQTSDRWQAIYIDDASTDNTVFIAKEFQIKYPEKFSVLINRERQFKAFNFLRAIEIIPDSSVVAELDADDALSSVHVVEEILKLHQKYDLVYTNHKTINTSPRAWYSWKSTPLQDNWSRNYPKREKVWDEFNFPGHLRTFKKYLFNYIDKKDLFYQGELLKVAFDMVYYTMLIEMTPSNKIYFLDKDYYNYMVREQNDQFTEDDLTSNGDKESHKDLCQTEIDKWFKCCPSYTKRNSIGNMKIENRPEPNLLERIFSVNIEHYQSSYYFEYKAIIILGVKIKIKRMRKRHRALTEIAYNLVEHCNLNCQSCNNFSQIAEEEFVSIDDFEKDMKRLCELTSGNVLYINLMGGEPLLHPDCVKFLEIARIYFPKTVIRLITNGILLHKQNEDFYLALKKNNITLTPTKYPIKVDWDSLQANCDKYGLKFEFHNNMEEIKTSFKLPLDLDGKQNPKLSFKHCAFPDCHVLAKGKLYHCTYSAFIRHFNKYFGQNLILKKKDYIDIYKAKNFDELIQYAARPIPFCRYCKTSENKFGLEWKLSKKVIEEYI